MKLDTPTVSLIGSALLFIASVVTLIFNRRESLARAKNQDVDALQKFSDMLGKLQDRNDKLYDQTIELEKRIAECEKHAEKLRQDLAIALVENADLKNENSKLTGYIQGITEPLIKMDDAQKMELRGRHRATDVK